MIKLEQVRAEVLERLDRRFAQSEQRLSRVEQRLTDLGDRLEALHGQLLAQLRLRTWVTGGAGLVGDTESEYAVELGPDDLEPGDAT